MPTAAKLVGAISFTFLAFIISTMIIPLMPEGTKAEYHWVLNCIVALVCGWKIMGPRGMGTRLEALTGGITTAIVAYLGATFLHAGTKMVMLSLRKIYHGPVEAVKAVFEIGFEWTTFIATPATVSSLIVGGMVCGWLAWIAGRKWG